MWNFKCVTVYFDWSAIGLHVVKLWHTLLVRLHPYRGIILEGWGKPHLATLMNPYTFTRIRLTSDIWAMDQGSDWAQPLLVHPIGALDIKTQVMHIIGKRLLLTQVNLTFMYMSVQVYMYVNLDWDRYFSVIGMYIEATKWSKIAITISCYGWSHLVGTLIDMNFMWYM